jgi:hypothetical protein
MREVIEQLIDSKGKGIKVSENGKGKKEEAKTNFLLKGEGAGVGKQAGRQADTERNRQKDRETNKSRDRDIEIDAHCITKTLKTWSQ